MTKQNVISGLLLLITTTLVSFAVLGIGDVVYDPAAVANLVRQFHQMEQEYVQLVATYQTVRSQYSQMIFMAKMAPMAGGTDVSHSVAQLTATGYVRYDRLLDRCDQQWSRRSGRLSAGD